MFFLPAGENFSLFCDALDQQSIFLFLLQIGERSRNKANVRKFESPLIRIVIFRNWIDGKEKADMTMCERFAALCAFYRPGLE